MDKKKGGLTTMRAVMALQDGKKKKKAVKPKAGSGKEYVANVFV